MRSAMFNAHLRTLCYRSTNSLAGLILNISCQSIFQVNWIYGHFIYVYKYVYLQSSSVYIYIYIYISDVCVYVCVGGGGRSCHRPLEGSDQL
jgi:hypothetical protein